MKYVTTILIVGLLLIACIELYSSYRGKDKRPGTRVNPAYELNPPIPRDNKRLKQR